MAEHDNPIDEPALGTGEPVAIAEVVRLLVAGLVTAGWVTIDSVTINAIATGVAAVLSVVFSLLARRKVTPVPPQ